MGRAEDLQDRIHFASLALEALRDQWQRARDRWTDPRNLVAALETIRQSRDELARLESDAGAHHDHEVIRP